MMWMGMIGGWNFHNFLRSTFHDVNTVSKFARKKWLRE
jgi:hypothetical protein